MTTLAQCWKVTRTDTTVFAFTDHDADLTVGGVTYKIAIGFVPSAIERSTELNTDNQTLTGLIDRFRHYGRRPANRQMGWRAD